MVTSSIRLVGVNLHACNQRKETAGQPEPKEANPNANISRAQENEPQRNNFENLRKRTATQGNLETIKTDGDARLLRTQGNVFLRKDV